MLRLEVPMKRKRAPAPSSRTFVQLVFTISAGVTQRDFRANNRLVHQGRLSGILDWE